MTKLIAIAFPVRKGKEEHWLDFAGELNGSRKEEFNASRKNMGVRERTFLQHTPNGDVIIVTLEGKDPEKALYQFAAGTDEFTRWFLQNVQDISGLDLTAPHEGHLSFLMVDSES